MNNDGYLAQVIHYFKKNFLDSEKADINELASVIREKLIMIEDREERKDLVSRIMEEIQDLVLIQKYRGIYGNKSHQLTKPIINNQIVDHLSYDFKRMI